MATARTMVSLAAEQDVLALNAKVYVTEAGEVSIALFADEDPQPTDSPMAVVFLSTSGARKVASSLENGAKKAEAKYVAQVRIAKAEQQIERLRRQAAEAEAKLKALLEA